jgi:ubiquinone/menaquinone biosynthesis C-methylase UbiE
MGFLNNKKKESSNDFVPVGDKELAGERDDMLKPETTGKRGAYEHIQRYRFAIRKIGSNKKVLDLGCGTGYGSGLLYKGGNEVHGIDISQKAVDYAKRNYPGPKYICRSGEKLPFKNNYFDAVTIFDVIEHIHNSKKTLDEVYRVLKRNGNIFISTPNKRHFGNMFKHFLFQKPYPEKVHIDNIYHIKEFYYDEFISFLKNHKFKIIFQYGQPFPFWKVSVFLEKTNLFEKFPRIVSFPFIKYAWTIVVYAKK